MENTIHVFERVGLGKAPFRYTGFGVETYQACPGAPIQVGTCCDFCGQGLKNVCYIESADGKHFKVGPDCVRKTGDAGLRKVVDAAVREHRNQVRRDREQHIIDEGRALLNRPDIRNAAKQRPHSLGFVDRTTGKQLTLLDDFEWRMKHSGNSGRVRTTKAIKAFAAAIED